MDCEDSILPSRKNRVLFCLLWLCHPIGIISHPLCQKEEEADADGFDSGDMQLLCVQMLNSDSSSALQRASQCTRQAEWEIASSCDFWISS
jgi:hypothetical protein